VFEGDRRFDIQVRLPESVRSDLALERLPIALPAQADSKTGFVPLSTVATFDLSPGPNQVSREDGKRRIVVSANVRGRDIGSFVEQAQRELDAIPMPSGYWTRWGGTFENMQSAQQRLQIVVPLALLMVFTCCLPCSAMCATGSSCSPDSLRTDRGHPGPVAAGHPLSISAAIGFIALSGVAVLNGLVMISSIRALRETGMAVPAAVHAGALARAPGADDRPGGLSGFCAHGHRDRDRRRGAAPAGHGGDWRHSVLHAADPAGASAALPPGPPA
jgi:cobalt-zinc-cadmium resistance protein CzcA